MVDQATQTKYRQAADSAMTWLHSSCATVDPATSAQLLDGAQLDVDAMILLAQTPGEHTLAASMVDAVAALRPQPLPPAPDKPPPPPGG